MEVLHIEPRKWKVNRWSRYKKMLFLDWCHTRSSLRRKFSKRETHCRIRECNNAHSSQRSILVIRNLTLYKTKSSNRVQVWINSTVVHLLIVSIQDYRQAALRKSIEARRVSHQSRWSLRSFQTSVHLCRKYAHLSLTRDRSICSRIERSQCRVSYPPTEIEQSL